jgi:hypothetical protein
MAGTAIFHRLAAREYRLARDWYTSRSAGVGKRFITAVGDAIVRIEQSPESLTYLIGPYRWARVRGFPYLLVLREKSPERILVVAVAHARRRPGYWRSRGYG